MRDDMIVSAEWLEAHLDDKNLRLVETPKKPEQYERAHIPGALRLPVHCYLKAEEENGELSDHIFDAKDFSDLAGALGMEESSEVVVYDEHNGLFAARFWWVCRYFGFNNVRVLNGGWQAWVEKNYPVQVAAPTVPEVPEFPVYVQSKELINMNELKAELGDGKLQIWDTRRPGEFSGTDKTSNQRKGHIPDSINILWSEMLTPAEFEGGPRFFKTAGEMESMLKQKGFRKENNIITHCQAAIRAAFGSFVLELLGYPNHRLYDGSMSEWANREDTPLVLSE